MKNSADRLKGRLGTAGGKIDALECVTVESIQSEAQRGKRLEK